MQLYDELISALLHLPSLQAAKPVAAQKPWPEDTEQTMILRGDMAFELGGERLPSIGCTLLTTEMDLVAEDSVRVVGQDLPEISFGSNMPYARISLVRLDPKMQLQGQALYSAIRKLEYTRYHYFPRGFMMRISSSRGKESVRVSREAIANGLSFAETGSLLAAAFRKDPAVQAVQTIYVTAGDFDYPNLAQIAANGEKITKTIDHIFKNVTMDCNACSLQQVCNEVEGLKALHFSQQQRK